MNLYEKSDFSFNYQKTIEVSPNGIIVIDSNSIIRFINHSAEGLMEISREKALGSSITEIIQDFDLNLNISDKEPSYKKKIKGNDLKFTIFRSDQDDDNYIIFINEDRNPVSIASELECAERMMDEMKDIIENSFDGILVTDGEGNVLLVNQAYIKSTGIDRDQLLGHNIKELINPIWMKNSVAVLVSEQKKTISLQHTTQNNKNIIVTGTPVFDKNNEVKRIVINSRDVSEIYSLQEELQKAREMEKYYFQKMSENQGEVINPTECDNIVVVSEKMKELFSLAKKLANFNTTVLITGESGVGKEEVAKYIHKNSERKDWPLVSVNCGAIPENLLESELFGYTEGSFTGALKTGKAGLFETANKGTLFLDEVGEMSMNLQVKLLRAIDSRSINRLGSSVSIPVDIRIIAATNQNLNQLVELGTFREDLFYRLNVVSINIPPLRERIEDIAPLILKYLHYFNMQYGQSKKMTFDVFKELESYGWPGNVRQLKNIIENMVVVSNNEYLQMNDIPWLAEKYKLNDKSTNKPVTMQEAIEYAEEKILAETKAKYHSTRKIAEVLEVDQSTVARKLKKYNL